MNESGAQVTCRRCGRVLRSVVSIAQGFGKECKRKALQEQSVADVPAWQVEKAKTDVIELGAIEKVVTRDGRAVFDVISSDAEQIYSTTAADCSCKAGQYGRLCYHRVAAMILDYRVKVRILSD